MFRNFISMEFCKIIRCLTNCLLIIILCPQSSCIDYSRSWFITLFSQFIHINALFFEPIKLV